MDKESKKRELEWRAEADADTLERYQEIINDKARLERAMKVAQEKVKNLTDRAKALDKTITGIKSKKEKK